MIVSKEASTTAEARHAGRSQDSRTQARGRTQGDGRSQTRHQDPGTTQEARLAEARHAGRSQDSRSQARRQKPGTTAEARHDITTQAHKNPSTTAEARQDRRTPVPAAVSKVNRPDTERILFYSSQASTVRDVPKLFLPHYYTTERLGTPPYSHSAYHAAPHIPTFTPSARVARAIQKLVILILSNGLPLRKPWRCTCPVLPQQSLSTVSPPELAYRFI